MPSVDMPKGPSGETYGVTQRIVQNALGTFIRARDIPFGVMLVMTSSDHATVAAIRSVRALFDLADDRRKQYEADLFPVIRRGAQLYAPQGSVLDWMRKTTGRIVKEFNYPEAGVR